MDKDKLKEIFDGFDPDLDRSFVHRLSRSIDMIERIERQHELEKRKTRRAMAAACMAAFAAGAFAMALMPTLPELVVFTNRMHLNVLYLGENIELLSKGVIASVAALGSAVCAYDLTMAISRVRSRLSD